MIASERAAASAFRAKAEAIPAMKLLMDLVCESVEAAGPLGAPAGPMYAALMAAGISLEQFNQLMTSCVMAGRLRRSGHLYFAQGD